MRAKHFVVILCCVVITTIIFIAVGPEGEPNDSLKSIVTHTHQQLNKLQENLRVAEPRKFDFDPKYLTLLGFSVDKDPQYYAYQTVVEADAAAAAAIAARVKEPSAQTQARLGQGPSSGGHNAHLPLQEQPKSSTSLRVSKSPSAPFNGTKANFSIVTYVHDGQAPSAILLSQNIAAKFPHEYLLIYDLGLSEDESRSLNAFCNSSKCSVIGYDLSVFPSHVADQRMHAYRPFVIKDALMRSHCILFAESFMRIRGGSGRELQQLQRQVVESGVLGWSSPTAVSTRTHPKMFDYFQTKADDFFFRRMVDLDAVLFTDSVFVTEKIMLPWIKCALTLECIDPIGAQSNGCKYNKKPQYRYSGCHGYDTSAFNIVLGLTWPLDDSKYSLPSDSSNIFYKETLEQATKILENRRRNSSETSDHPFTED